MPYIVLNGRGGQEIVNGEPVCVRKVVEQAEATDTLLLSDRSHFWKTETKSYCTTAEIVGRT